MSEANEQILSAARNYVTGIFKHQINPEFVFHSLEHTEDVVEACSRMAAYYKLPDEDQFVLLLAAWFHDTGYSIGEANGHEAESIKHATQFLTQNGADETVVQRVASCIAATKMPQSPVSQVEKILCDADLAHLATEDFKGRTQLLKQEQEMLLGHKISKKEWRKNNLTFLSNHKYFTEYGQEKLEPGKQENINSLKKKKELEKETKATAQDVIFPYLSPGDRADDAKAMKKNTERGIQTMFRSTSNNHLRLSSMSDNKSHIMISVNSIIIGIIISVVFKNLASVGQYTIPSYILLAVCLSSMTLAVLATRPSVNKGQFTEEDIRNKRTNLLFFGNFYRMGVDDYQWAMNQMIKDGEYLYNSMIKDIYFLGVVLAKKYRYLRWSYTIFMVGLIISVIAFGIAAAYAAKTSEILPAIDY